MNTIFLNMNHERERQPWYLKQLPLHQTTYSFDDVSHVIQFNFFSRGFFVLFLCCDNPTAEDYEAIPLLREHMPDSHIVMLSENDGYEWVRGAFLAGADDYVVVRELGDLEEYCQRRFDFVVFRRIKNAGKQW